MAHASTFFGYHSDCRLNLLSHVCRYDTLWDPKLADEAERRGEDIQGFLSGEHELVKKQCLMALLHMFGYRDPKAPYAGIKGTQELRILG